MIKRIDIEYLYLDLDICNPCQSTESVLDQAVLGLTPILKECGFKIKVNKIHVETENQARKLKLVSSPTIRVNGLDIQPEISEDVCDCCSSIAGDNEINCRVWLYEGKEYWTPPKAMIMNSILSRVYSNSKVTINNSQYSEDIPDNLKSFFNARDKKISRDSPVSSTCCQPNNRCS